MAHAVRSDGQARFVTSFNQANPGMFVEERIVALTSHYSADAPLSWVVGTVYRFRMASASQSVSRSPLCRLH